VVWPGPPDALPRRPALPCCCLHLQKMFDYV
jgi:hypothetical protein